MTLATTVTMVSTLLPFHLSVAGAVQPLPPVADADGRLGLCDVLPGSAPGATGVSWGELAYNAGARLNRWEFRWDRVEPSPETWDYSSTDTAVKESEQAGLNILGILIGTPAWAAAPGQRPGNGLPSGLSLPYTDPHNLWAEYVRETVTRYQGEVDYWEVWNEPDLRFFWMGSPDDYFRLLKVAFLTIRDADPNAKVLMAGMVVPDLAFLTHVLDDAARDAQRNDNHGYFDAVAWHAYGPTRLVYTNVTRFKALLESRRFANVPLWVTEDGFPASNPNGEPRQAAYVLQTIAYALAAGAARVLVYRASDDVLPKTWGLISAAGNPRMGYVAFQVAAQYFAHAQAVTYLPVPGIERFVFYGPAQRVTLLWNRSLADRTLALSAVQPSAKRVDWMGAVSPLAVEGGASHIVLPGASYNQGVDPSGSVVGGPPVLIVEDNTPPSKLIQTSYLPSVPGSVRRLVIFNQGSSLATAQVSPVAHPRQRMVLQLPPRTLETADLDLLAGTGYHGMYAVSSSAALAEEAVSDQVSTAGLSPAPTWYMAAPPPSLVLGNPGNEMVAAQVLAFGAKGVVRIRERVELDPARRSDWTPPSSLRDRRYAIALRANAPIVVGSEDAPVTPVAQPQTRWYALYVRRRQLSIFNPDPALAAQVDVHFVGATAVKGEQLQVAPRHSFSLSAHAAGAIVLEASRGVTVGDRGPALTAALTSQVITSTALTVAGGETRVALFNPSGQRAHVSLSLVAGASARQVTALLAPSQLSSVPVRGLSGSPRGVSVSSDVPIVAVPTA